MTETVRFQADDFADDLPRPGTYPALVDVARYRRSARGNDMIQVVYALDGEARGQRVSEYFVLGGSPRGRAVARRRLLQLYQACGLKPAAGDEVSPADLFGLRLEVRVVHDDWDGKRCLRVIGYRRPDASRTPF